MKTLDIKQRLLFLALLPATIISVVLTLYLVILRFDDADHTLLEHGTALTRVLTSAAAHEMLAENLPELQRLAETVAHEPNVTAVTFYDRYGLLQVRVGESLFVENPTKLNNAWTGASPNHQTLFFHGKVLPAQPPLNDPFQDAPAAPRQEVDAHLAAMPPSSTPLGSVILEISCAEVIAAKQKTLQMTLLLSIAALMISALLARRLSRDVTEPIQALQKTVAAIQHGDLGARVTPHPASTLLDLENGVNAMAAALQAGHNALEDRITAATQELRLQKEEAERMNQAKSRFLAAASHDLRQPLHALTLFLSELETTSSPSDQGRIMRRINTAIDALNVQFNALLDISRLDLADVVARQESIALEALIARVIAVHLPAAQAKGLRLRCMPTRAWVRTDPRLLERMIGNLLSNAIRYTEQGGILIGVRPCGDRWRLEIWDSGIGINSEQVPLIFHEFYQIANSERDADKGLGLGLTIVARLAKILDHPITVRSRLGHGSVFSITMPATSPQASTEQSGEGLRDLAAGFNIDVALLSANLDATAGLAKLLKGWGCRVCQHQTPMLPDTPFVSQPEVLICDEASYAEASNIIRRGPMPEPILLLIGTDAPQQDRPAAKAQLELPLRPARLRALLQHLLQERQQNIEVMHNGIGWQHI